MVFMAVFTGLLPLPPLALSCLTESWLVLFPSHTKHMTRTKQIIQKEAHIGNQQCHREYLPEPNLDPVPYMSQSFGCIWGHCHSWSVLRIWSWMPRCTQASPDPLCGHRQLIPPLPPCCRPSSGKCDNNKTISQGCCED